MQHKPLLAALNGQVLSRPPFWLMRQAGRYLPEYRELRAKAGGFLDLCFTPELAAEVTLQPIRRFGMDAAILFSDILVVPYALGQPLRFAEGEGPRLEAVRSAQDLKRLSKDRFHERLAPVYETVRRVKAGLPDDVALIGFAGSPWTVATYMVEGSGSKDFAEIKTWAFRDPEGFGQLLDILVDATIEYLCAQIDAGAEAVQLFDTWAGVLSVDCFSRFVIEPTRQIVEGVRQRHPNIPIIGFPRGAGLMYAGYAAETGVTALGLDTTVPPDWAAVQLQPRWPVQGNLDPVLLIAGGQILDKAVDELLSSLAEGPFILNLGHGILPQTPPEHVAQLAARIKNHANG